MKIVAVNGSPKGKTSNTGIMVNAFLKGAQNAGAEIDHILLAEKEINYCRGCSSCWMKTPGKCVIQDDMEEVLSRLATANIIILATPLFFNNVSGTLKVFIDRLTATGNPHSQKNIKEKHAQGTPSGAAPKLMLISNCGFPVRSQFDVISLWIKRLAQMMQTEVVGEIYVTQGKLLSSPSHETRPSVAAYLRLLEDAGKEIAVDTKLSDAMDRQLNLVEL